MRQQIYLGSDQFIANHEKMIKEKESLDQIPMLQKRKTAKSIDFYQTKYKDEKQAIYQTYLSGSYTLKCNMERPDLLANLLTPISFLQKHAKNRRHTQAGYKGVSS